MIPYKNSPLTFIIFAFIIRMFMAVGVSACATATFAIATSIFRKNISTVLVSRYNVSLWTYYIN